MKNLVFALSVFLGLYLVGFIVVHRSSSLLRPAANLACWYYGDTPLIEAVEFYGFFPLRQLTYLVAPHFISRHNDERVPPSQTGALE
jgi:hypothetical protein